jgi:hypothetical protein
MRKFLCVCAAIGGVVLPALVARGHGYVGNRFFPPTIATDDPFATDELAFPTVAYGLADHEVDTGIEFDKEILPKFAVGFSDTYIYQKPNGQPRMEGWDNLSLSAKYQLWQNVPHEAIVSVGMEADIGRTGAAHLGVDNFNTYTPTVYVGKGLGDLPDSLNGFKPLAVTATLGQTFPGRAESPNSLEWGVAIEYSMPYLQQHVSDIGLPAPIKNIIPLVEFSMETPENRGPFGPTTGTVNPGVLWEARMFQIGAEAMIPVNGRTGPHVGAVVQLQLFIDDIFPAVFGHPLFFGGEK